MTASHPVTVEALRRAAVAAALALSIGSGVARGQSVDSLTSPAESTQTAILFDSDAPLRLRFEGDLRTLIDDRDSVESTEHAFDFTYQVGDAAPVAVPVELKTRGHWRRQERHCDFPPLRVNVPRGKVDGTLFGGQDKLKLVTPCRPSMKDYEDYVLREYLVYKVYNLLTPLSHRVRLATTTYVDTTRRRDSLTTHTFLIEDPEEMAARNDGKLLEIQGAEFDLMDSVQIGLVGVFMYMIGQTDWSLRGLHNIELVQDLQRGTFYPVAYDFDFTGIVNTVYARPDPRLRLPSVRQRLYRGACLSDEAWAT
ncbi:MAG: hypothetical protein OEW56_05875, partial [Gemmatimonadota bacterium]|nr:hypothetical protein [Gemmatimonadota bacterium]